jgi:hypothetical protein
VIRDVTPDSFCDIEQFMTEASRESLLLSDGHHLSEEGHRFYAENVRTGEENCPVQGRLQSKCRNGDFLLAGVKLTRR